nr:MAG TPA: hypothetical protein [Caudoviricetes sp.]
MPNQTLSSSLISIRLYSPQNRFYCLPSNPISISPNSYHYSIALPSFSTISTHFYLSTSSIVENVEKFVENLLKTPNHIQILSNSCSNLQEIPRKPPLDTLYTQITIRFGDLTHIFSLNYVIELGN